MILTSTKLIDNVIHAMHSFIAGWLYDATGYYDPSFYTAGTLILVSGLVLLPLSLNCFSHKDSTEHTASIEEVLC